MRGLIHHIDLTVGDLARSTLFYDRLLGFLGYRMVRQAADGVDWDLRTAGHHASIGIKPARSDAPHDRYARGLHHLAWQAKSRDDVERLHQMLMATEATILDAPAAYPAYGDGYYAVFFADPDGLKLEFVHD